MFNHIINYYILYKKVLTKVFKKISYFYLSKTNNIFSIKHIIIKKNMHIYINNFFLFKKKLFIKKTILNKINLNIANCAKIKYTEFFFNNKFIFFNKKNFLIINFLRNNNIYIKSKYSKARPFCKSIVIFSLFLNIIIINELHSIYYNVSINYSYLIIIVYIIVILYSLYLFVKLLGR